MANYLIIVHGYSDGYTKPESSFRKLKKFLSGPGRPYDSDKVHFVEYSSMDDQATYEDFADKLDSDYEKKIPNKARVDILCHSTGALVTRIWLASRRQRQREMGQSLDLPVDRIYMFAPANFGSDLARMGQSFLGKAKSTFFSCNRKAGNRWESGRIVLQGLEPASPFQWNLSMDDLHSETYFGPNDPSGKTCKVFIFAAGMGYPGQGKIVRTRNKPGTDGTVRICGTNMNTRKCTLYLAEPGRKLHWAAEVKHPAMPFAVFQHVNHGTILDPDTEVFKSQFGAGTLLLESTRVKNMEQYQKAHASFSKASEENYKTAKGEDRERYQQFFFKVRDDAGFNVDDFFIDFKVTVPNPPKPNPARRLSRQFDEVFEERITTHSQDRSHRAFLVNFSQLQSTLAEVEKHKAKVVLKVTARKPYDEVSYDDGEFEVFDASKPKDEQPNFLFENTTTLVEIVMNRRQSDEILQLRKSL
jgi:hypothetical protein